MNQEFTAEMQRRVRYHMGVQLCVERHGKVVAETLEDRSAGPTRSFTLPTIGSGVQKHIVATAHLCVIKLDTITKIIASNFMIGVVSLFLTTAIFTEGAMFTTAVMFATRAMFTKMPF